jgi:hypothetical protein
LHHAGFLHGFIFDPEDGGDIFLLRELIFIRLHGIMSQDTELFKILIILFHLPKLDLLFKKVRMGVREFSPFECHFVATELF